MTKTGLLASAAALIFAGPALAIEPLAFEPQAAAQAPRPTGPERGAPLADAAQQGVLVFTPDFFADARPNTALDMVNRVPGFSVNDGTGARGFEGAVGNILINGARPASKSDTGSGVLGRTTANQVERIELIRGGAPGIDMQGYSVVVNVILTRQSARQHIVTYNATVFEGGPDLHGAAYQVTARDGDRNWGLTLSDGISMSDSNGPGRVVRLDPTGAILRDEALDTGAGGGGQSIRGNYATPFLGGRIDLTARLSVNDWDEYQLQRSSTVRRDGRYASESQGGEVGAAYQRPLPGRWNLETRFIHQFSESEAVSTNRTTVAGAPLPEQVFASDSRSSETILRGLARGERSAGLTIEGGAEAAYNMLDTFQAFTIDGAPVPLPSDEIKVEELRGEAFGKVTWRIRPDLTLEGGLRLETSTITQSRGADEQKSLFFAKPRMLATWTPSPAHQLRLRFERELGQLNFGDFAASANLNNDAVFGGNVDLRPEQRWITELIYEGRFWGEGVLSVTLRHDEIVDALDRMPLPGGLSARGNIGDGTLHRLAVSLTLPTDRLGISGGRFRFNNTWNDTRVTDPTTGQARRMSRIRASQPTLSFQQDIASWRLQWGVDYIVRLEDPTFDPDFTSLMWGEDYRSVFVEYKPTPTLALRLQYTKWDDLQGERTVFADRQPPRPVAYVERREIDPRDFWSLRVRKTF